MMTAMLMYQIELNWKRLETIQSKNQIEIFPKQNLSSCEYNFANSFQ